MQTHTQGQGQIEYSETFFDLYVHLIHPMIPHKPLIMCRLNRNVIEKQTQICTKIQMQVYKYNYSDRLITLRHFQLFAQLIQPTNLLLRAGIETLFKVNKPAGHFAFDGFNLDRLFGGTFIRGLSSSKGFKILIVTVSADDRLDWQPELNSIGLLQRTLIPFAENTAPFCTLYLLP